MPPSLAMRSMLGVSPTIKPAVITARLHPADVVAHDEQDVGLLAVVLAKGHIVRCEARRHNANRNHCDGGQPTVASFHVTLPSS